MPQGLLGRIHALLLFRNHPRHPDATQQSPGAGAARRSVDLSTAWTSAQLAGLLEHINATASAAAPASQTYVAYRQGRPIDQQIQHTCAPGRLADTRLGCRGLGPSSTNCRWLAQIVGALTSVQAYVYYSEAVVTYLDGNCGPSVACLFMHALCRAIES